MSAVIYRLRSNRQKHKTVTCTLCGEVKRFNTSSDPFKNCSLDGVMTKVEPEDHCPKTRSENLPECKAQCNDKLSANQPSEGQCWRQKPPHLRGPVNQEPFRGAPNHVRATLNQTRYPRPNNPYLGYNAANQQQYGVSPHAYQSPSNHHQQPPPGYNNYHPQQPYHNHYHNQRYEPYNMQSPHWRR